MLSLRTMSRKNDQLCIYCGLAQADTLDHVPPKCLFTKPRPSNLYTVPCCATCNASLASDDEYFRTAMAFRWDVSDHSAARAIVDKALRATGRAHGFRRLFTHTLEDAPIVTHGGIYVEAGGRFKSDMERINRVLARIVRGLYYKKLGTPLATSHHVSIIADEILEQSDARLRNEILTAWQPHVQGEPETFGNETFLFFWYVDIVKDQTCWLLVFFSRVIFFAITTSGEQLFDVARTEA